MVVANASNARVVSDALAERLDGFRAVLDDRSLATGLVAVQGPRSLDILGPLTDLDLVGDPATTGSRRATVAGIPAQVARTGYTGEDGFELFVDVDRAGELWDALLDGRAARTARCRWASGARDTLRLEAGMPLYGNELDRSTNPFEAGLGRVVKLVQARRLRRPCGAGAGRRATASSASSSGLEMRDRGIARHGYPVLAGDAGDARGSIGTVTSGTMSPTLGKAIAMAYVPPADAAPGTMLAVEIRGAPVAAEVVPLPFYKRPA